MPDRNDGSVAAPRMGGKIAVFLFIVTLFSFVIETQLAQYVQTNLGFRKPYFIFYIVHSAFAMIFPMQFLYLVTIQQRSPRTLLKDLSNAITIQLSGEHSQLRTTVHAAQFPLNKFLRLALVLTAGYSLPGLLWFASISLASVSDVTALWNTNAFFAYIFTVKIFQLKWETRRLMAVLLATFGVIVVVYGGSTSSSAGGDAHPESTSTKTIITTAKPTFPLLGDLMTLLASLIYGLYQVLYKKYVALPSDPEAISDGLYEQVASSEDGPSPEDATETRPLPFGIYPNLLTSLIGLFTLVILWIPLPILHYYGIETFSLPTNTAVFFTIAGMATAGVLFNAGFMVLLGVWGPVLVSVGNLLTIVLVLISDVLLGGATDTITVWSLMGAGVIVAAFSVLAYDMYSASTR